MTEANNGFSYVVADQANAGVTGAVIEAVYTGEKPFHGMATGSHFRLVQVEMKDGTFAARHLPDFNMVLSR
jgi:hypothetical protein